MIAKVEKVLLVRPSVILMLLVVLAFANSLQNDFVWDDQGLIVDNPKIEFSLKEIFSVFTTPLWKMAGLTEAGQGYYRPMVSLLFILDYKIWGLNPVGFHLTNIFLHIIAVIVSYKIGLLLFYKDENAKLISLIAASVFAIHPAHNEPIGRSASGEVIFGFFIIISLYFFLKDKKYLSWLTFFLALMSKEAAIMLPFALIILSTDKKGLIAITPYIILVGIYVVMRTMFADTVLGYNVNQPLLTRLITMAVATFDYVKLFLIPYPLSPFYSAKWYTSIFEFKVLIAIASFILITFHAVTLRNDRTMLFLILFPLSMLVPVIFRVNTFPVGSELVYIAERFLYVPVMLFSLLISAYTVRLAGEKSKKHLIIGWTLIIAIFTGITVSANTIWRNNIALYTKIIQASPNAAFAHNNLGNAYYAKGLKNEAFNEYKTAVKLKPYDIVFHQNLGEVYYLEGELNNAVQEFNAALKPMSDAHKFDNVHSKQGALNQADINKTFWEYQPCFADTHFYLGLVYLAQGDIDKATRKFKVASILKPDFAEAHYNLGNVYQKQSKLDEAVKEYGLVLKLNSNYANTRNKLEILSKKLKNE